LQVHTPRGDRDQEQRDLVDPIQLSKFTNHLSPISSERNSGPKAQPERGDQEDEKSTRFKERSFVSKPL